MPRWSARISSVSRLFAGLSGWRRARQSLVDVDVPEARERALVEECNLQRCAAVREARCERGGAEAAGERLLAQAGPRGTCRARTARPGAARCRRTSRYVTSDPSSSLTTARVCGPSAGTPAGVPETPRHPEVHQEHTPALEPNNQILAATLHRGDALAFELPRDHLRVERPGQPRIVDRDALERAPEQHGLEARANGLDLGQLGHVARLAGAGQVTRSSRIGRSSGGSRRARRPRARGRPRRSPPRRYARGSRRAPRRGRPCRRACGGRRHRPRGRSRRPCARPAPSSSAAIPGAHAARGRTLPRAPRRTEDGCSWSASSLGSPPCARTHAVVRLERRPVRMAASARRRPSSASTPRSENASSCPVAVSTSSVKSGDPSPRASRAPRGARARSRPRARAAGPCP